MFCVRRSSSNNGVFQCFQCFVVGNAIMHGYAVTSVYIDIYLKNVRNFKCYKSRIQWNLLCNLFKISEADTIYNHFLIIHIGVSYKYLYKLLLCMHGNYLSIWIMVLGYVSVITKSAIARIWSIVFSNDINRSIYSITLRLK